MMAEPTPGPWTIELDNDTGPNDEGFWEWYQVGPARVDIHRKWGEEKDEEAEANAHLIAAALDLLDAAKGSLAWLELMAANGEAPAGPIRRAIKFTEAAIAKAKGGNDG
jgi:hypothetical protein